MKYWTVHSRRMRKEGGREEGRGGRAGGQCAPARRTHQGEYDLINQDNIKQKE